MPPNGLARCVGAGYSGVGGRSGGRRGEWLQQVQILIILESISDAGSCVSAEIHKCECMQRAWESTEDGHRAACMFTQHFCVPALCIQLTSSVLRRQPRSEKSSPCIFMARAVNSCTFGCCICCLYLPT